MYVLSIRVITIALPVIPFFIPAGFLKSISTLTNPKQRDEWEKCFNKTYIQPVLTNLDKYIQMTMKGIMEDSEKGVYDWKKILINLYCISTSIKSTTLCFIWSMMKVTHLMMMEMLTCGRIVPGSHLIT